MYSRIKKFRNICSVQRSSFLSLFRNSTVDIGQYIRYQDLYQRQPAGATIVFSFILSINKITRMSVQTTTFKMQYAENYSRLPPYTGTRYLIVRDMPALIKRYVEGTVTLDYGCGVGLSTRFLKNLGLIVDGVDINEYILKKAKALDPAGTYSVIKSGEIPVKNGHYDFVNCIFVLGNVATKQELLKIMLEVARVLKLGGTFIAVINSKDTYNNDWNSIDTRFEENKNLKSGSVVKFFLKDIDFAIYNYYWSEEDIQEVITESGLVVVHTHKPLGTESDGYAWVSEHNKAFVAIIVAKKIH